MDFRDIAQASLQTALKDVFYFVPLVYLLGHDISTPLIVVEGTAQSESFTAVFVTDLMVCYLPGSQNTKNSMPRIYQKDT